MSEMANLKNINVSGLIKHAEARSQSTVDKVDVAIRNLIKNNQSINFNSVSVVSGVSKAFLYKNIEVRQRIEGLREQYNFPSKNPSKKHMTESSKDVIIASKNKKIKELEEENKYLKEQLMILRGKLYDSI